MPISTRVREEICSEAIRLTGLLAEHAAGNQPKTHALLALMLLNGARIPTRVDGEGNLLRLKEQDRTRWDQPMIARGMFHFAQSAAGEEITEYHQNPVHPAQRTRSSRLGNQRSVLVAAPPRCALFLFCGYPIVTFRENLESELSASRLFD